MGYRLTIDDIEDTLSYAFEPDSRDVNLFSGFLQDDITLVSDKLQLTLGSKFEHNDYTGFEIQPTARLLFTPRPNHSLWAAVSRAVRTPSRGEHDGTVISSVIPPNALFPGSPLTFVGFSGDDDYKSEELIAYEAGYRFRPFEDISLDLAAFINDYDHLRTIEPVSLTSFEIGNKLHGYTYGLELAADYRMMDWWRLQAGYTFIKLDLELDNSSGDTTSEAQEHESPQHQFSLRSSMDLPYHIELDLWLRAVDNLDAKQVSSYTTCDLRLAWSPIQNLELALVGRNLFEGRHLEFKQELLNSASSSEIERSIYGKVTWRF